MIWLVQNAMFGDEFGIDQFTAAIDATGDRRIQLDYVFWESTIDLKLTDTVPSELIPFGTRSFVAYAMKQGWKVFWDKSYEYSSLLALGEEFINYDMTVGPLDKLVVPDQGKIYIREAAGFNIIKGKVINAYAWPDWVRGFTEDRENDSNPHHHDWHPINGDSLFVTAPVKTITDEWRVWVINGEVVSASQYVRNGDIQYSNADENWYVTSYAQRMVEKFPFATDSYVIDIFKTDKGLKVGEINCLHCSGWYHVNPQKVVHALSK
jgi:hypothetical protein